MRAFKIKFQVKNNSFKRYSFDFDVASGTISIRSVCCFFG